MSSISSKWLLFPFAVALAASLSSCVVDSGPPYNSYHHNYGGVPSYYSGGYGYRPAPSYYRGRYYDDGYRYRGRDDDRIKLTAGQQHGKPNRPEGYHSPEWYKNRDYKLDQYKHKHEDSGTTHKGSSYNQKSSGSSKKSGGSSKKSSGSSESSGGGSHKKGRG